jgi:hypothetical protein
MAPFETFASDFDSRLKIVADKQVLHINREKRKITCHVKAVRFQDKDTKQYVIYVPSHELTGYGATEKKAMEMLKSSIDDFCKYLMNLSVKEMNAEISKLGWKQNRLRKKDYSKAYVDIDGNLKSFNAMQDKVEFVDIKMSA